MSPQEAYALAKGLSVADAVETYTGERLKRFGHSYSCVCPFCGAKAGKFMIDKSKNIAKCFNEDFKSLNAPAFVAKITGQSYYEACLELLEANGTIDSNEHSRLLGKGKAKVVKPVPVMQKKKQEYHREQGFVEPEIIQRAYLALRDICGLSKDHYSHLSEVRHLTEGEIKKDYFSFPVEGKKEIVDKILGEISKEKLMHVPGFYKGKYGISLSNKQTGIGILIRNAKGHVVGCQIRRDTVEKGEQRYIWLSSSWALDNPKLEGGASCGSPVDVLYPSDMRKYRGTLCITEGKFKASALAQDGKVAVSVQGVGNWAGVIEAINTIRALGKYRVDRIIIMYDSDMMRKVQIFKHAERLADALNEDFPDIPIAIAGWKEENGKGIDDVIFAANGKSVKLFKEDAYRKVYECILEQLMQKFETEEKTPQEILLDETFREELQRNLENVLKL